MPKINEEFLNRIKKNRPEERPDDYHIPNPKYNHMAQIKELNDENEENLVGKNIKKCMDIDDENNAKLPLFNVYNYVPKNIAPSPVFKETRGEFHIPHSIFEFRCKAIKSREELIIFDCLLRFSLGFHRSECSLSNSFIAEWTGIKPQNVRRGLKKLLSSGLITKTKNGRVKSPSCFDIPIVMEYLYFLSIKNKKLEDCDREVKFKKIDLFLSKVIKSKNVQRKEREVIDDLIKLGKDEEEIIGLADFLMNNGTLNGEKCDRPFTYLASGTYDKILNRMNGIKDFDPTRIFTAIIRYNTREPLPKDFADTLTQKELDWISNKGGRSAIGQWTESKLKRDLHLI